MAVVDNDTIISENDLTIQRERIKLTHLYYPLSDSTITYIDTIDKLYEASNIIDNDNHNNVVGMTTNASTTTIITNATIIGVDVEWKPVFGYSANNCASLLQVATKDKVLIFDLLALIGNSNNDSSSSKLKDNSIQLISSIFSSSSLAKLGTINATTTTITITITTIAILTLATTTTATTTTTTTNTIITYAPIIGFGFSKEDIKMLAKVGLTIDNPKNLIDIQAMKFSKLNNDDKSQVPLQKPVQSLTGICEAVLGKPIYKVFQISDWSKRPLLYDQILYASLDAHVLLALYDTENQTNLNVKDLYLSQSTN